MFAPANTRRPRPPGIRRPLRSAAGEAAALPIKTQPGSEARSPARSKGKQATEDYFSPVPSRPSMRGRPLSMLSESSAASGSVLSPPPPYRHGMVFSPQEKSMPMGIGIPPPPDPLESGPSSVRTSLMEVEGVDNMLDDTDEESGTLTLRGVQKMIRQHELDELSSRLVPYSTAPNEGLPSLFDLRTSPTRSSGGPVSPFHFRTVPSASPYNRHQPRQPSYGSVGDRDLRLAAARAEEDEERIAALEAALAEARDGEEMQRKAAARLRRDVSRLQKQLEYTEDVVADREKYSFAAVDLDRQQEAKPLSEVDEWRRALVRGSYGPPPEDDHGVVSETAVDTSDDAATQASDGASETTTKVRIDRNETLEDVSRELDAPPSPSSGPAETVVLEESEAPTVMLSTQGKIRPPITSATFATPDAEVALDSPRLGSAQLKPSAASPRKPLTPCSANRKAARTSPSKAKSPASPKVRSPALKTMRSHGSIKSVASRSLSVRVRVRNRPLPTHTPGHRRQFSDASMRHRRTDSAGSSASLAKSIFSHMSASPLSAFHSRMDSVRSLVSEYLGNQRTLGSELGSNFAASPVKQLDEQSSGCSSLAEPSKVSTPTAKFLLRGPLAASAQTSAYDKPGGNGFDAPRRLRFADWSPHSWASPTPSPRPVPNAAYLARPDFLVRPAPVPSNLNPNRPSTHFTSLSYPGQGRGATPSPRHTTYLTPCVDPWDEYSDRATPSPRPRALRPLLLCTRPAVHARQCSLALARDRTSKGLAFSGLSERSDSSPPKPAEIRLTLRRQASFQSVRYPPLQSVEVTTASKFDGPRTVPGRVTHDFFCIVLLVLDYFEWALILLYRLVLDIRAGPDGDMIPSLGYKRRVHQRRFYV